MTNTGRRPKRVLNSGLGRLALRLACPLRCAQGRASAATDVADAAMRGDRDAVRARWREGRRQRAQVDGTTALHWAVERDDLDMADLLIRAGRASRPPTVKASRRCSSRRSTAARR